MHTYPKPAIFPTPPNFSISRNTTALSTSAKRANL